MMRLQQSMDFAEVMQQESFGRFAQVIMKGRWPKHQCLGLKRLKARTMGSQKTEVICKCMVINKMSNLGTPRFE